ncbi:EAL domain-containing protein [Vibrio diazotrophicus]|uniref:EAL domain-containing protein n=1 Tax=Vibrio diazotrophicus TaxID=685 RepID=UPI0022AF8BF8|nr:EAL domain-containing protein [Vibrio diazotrophicus]MCZ4370314.1 EAL domain-containing protein [Vibrio diazotrophicus]
MKRSLKSAILIPFIVVFFITFIGITSIQIYKFEQQSRMLGEKKILSITNNIKTKLDNFLKETMHFGMVIGNVIASNEYNKGHDISNVQDYLHSTVTDVYHLLPQVEVVGFGSSSADYVGFRKGENGDNQLILKDSRTKGRLTFYSGDSVSSDAMMTVNNYDPRNRPWYLSVLEAKNPIWSTLYTSIDVYNKTNSTISASIPINNKSGDIDGVVSLDINIEQLINFMLKLKSEYDATVYIFNDNGELISNTGSDNISNVNYSRGGITLDPVIIKSLQHISDFKNHTFDKVVKYKTHVGDEGFYNSITPYAAEGTEDFRWYIGVSVSQSSLLEVSVENRILSWLIGLSICTIGLWIVAYHINKIIYPIELTIEAADMLASGHKIGKIKNDGEIKEIQTLVNSFNRMSLKIERTIDKLKNQAFHDDLTKLYSKAGLIDSYQKIKDKKGTLLVFSISTFKNINDSLGYEKGDLVLKEVANRLTKFSEEDSLIARIDGGKFALLSPRELDFRQSKTYAKSIKQFLTERLIIDGVEVAFRISVGVVTDIQDYSGIEQCLRNASVALSDGQKGQGRISHFSREMLEKIEHKTQMCADIKHGIENHEFTPFYQPIVELKTGEVVGAEALARWISPKLGMVPPDRFIPIAEESGFIDQLGELILLQACSDITNGIAEGKWTDDFKMHVNISVLQLSRSSFLTSLQDIMSSTQVSPNNLSLEITESGLAENKGIFNRNLEAIIAMGIHVSIDDFGTGYSSLSYLQELDFDCLKIDRAFISTLTEENFDSSLTAMILNISKTIDTYVVAEGIETETQAKLLNRLDCQFGQGYFFGKPAPYECWNY